MPGPINTICHTLLEAVLTLYPANAVGEPILTQPLWMGVEAHDLTFRDRWLKKETRPSGAKFPRHHPLVPQFEISIGRVWVLPLSQREGFIPGRGNYVLDVVWRDEDSDYWHREVYYGVTISGRDRAARDRDGEFLENQVFDAQYFVPSHGQGVPPTIPPSLVYTVRYLTDSENVELYRYNPDTDLFAESVAGITTGRATLTYAPDHSGIFDVLFAGEPYPSLRINAAKQVEVFALRQGAPTQADLPRVEFWYGQYRVAAVTRDGALHATKFQALNPLEGNKFQFFADGDLAMTFEPAAATGNFVVFNPQQVTGLKLWTRVESLGLNDLAEVWVWPDESGNGNDLSVGDNLLTEAGLDLVTEGDEDLLLETGAGGNPPALLQAPAQDEWTHHSLPVSGGALRFQANQFLRTRGTILDADSHYLLVVACPFGPGSGVAATQKLLGSDTGMNAFQLQLTDEMRAQARFSPDLFGSPSLNTATGLVLGSLTQQAGWHLFEQEGAARQYTPDITSLDLLAGTLPGAIYSYVIVDVLPGGELSPSLPAAFDLTGSGGAWQLRVNLPAATPTATARRLYRTKVSGSTDHFLRATLAANATSYDDNMSMATFAATNPAALTAPSRNGFLSVRVDGVTQATVADLVGVASNTAQPVQVGASSDGFWGFVKAVLVYDTNPSEADKARLRRFLNNAYWIY